tara:strand:- start:462 stop:971 length:510 start_codon:yes stop_codon:yes gene_type:complete
VAVKKPTRISTFKDKEPSAVSPLQLAESIVQRVEDRVDWWLANSKRVSTGRPSETRKNFVNVHITALIETRDLMRLLLNELQEWRNVLWPRATADILTKHAFQAQLKYKDLYKLERLKNHKSAMLALKMKAGLSKLEAESILAKLDDEYLSDFVRRITELEPQTSQPPE